jgi:hypothetical protein
MAKPTFRDFAGAVMGGDQAAAGKVLGELLELGEQRGAGAAAHFQAQMAEAGPVFMGKAMGLRAAVEGGKDEEIAALLRDCFGLSGEELDRAVAAVKPR